MRAAVAAAALAFAPQAEAQMKAGWETNVEAVAQKMPRFARTYGDATPPHGFIAFCQKHSSACEPFPGTPSERMRREDGGDFQRLQLGDTNAEVNALPQVSDLELFGLHEYWTIAGHRGGDCEDLAALKQALLQRVRGFKPNNLLLTHVVIRKTDGTPDEGHIVLMVRLKEGDFILDNRSSDIMPWGEYAAKHGYVFLSRQSYLDPKVWVSLQPKR